MTPTALALPREIAPGVFWLGVCMEVPFEGKIVHGYNSSYLVVGDQHSAFIETGITFQSRAIIEQFDKLKRERDLPDPRYLFVSHGEMAHSGGVGLILDRYPEATVHGEVSDLHMVFPQFADRQHFAEPGERFDLGGREVVVTECVFRDLIHSRWYFDTGARVLFPGDGFAYGHYHEDGACGHFAEEAPDVDVVNGVSRFALLAFHWTQFVDIEPYIARLDELIFDELGVQLVAPTHGLPISDLKATMPYIREGMRGMRALATSGATAPDFAD